MFHSSPVAYLFDVDNTLLDSDRVVDDLRRHLSIEFSEDDQRHYWKIFEELQEELGYADYLGALQRYRCEKPPEQHFLKLSLYLLDYPFIDRLFPKALDVIAYLKQRGLVTIVSDGDVVFQPRKIEASGLFEAVESRVLVYIHKEKDLHHVQHHFPAHHYVVIEDKPRVLAAAKKVWKDRATTIFVRQGRHAHDPKHVKPFPDPDLTVERIGDLLNPDYSHMFDRFV
jgi:FMN phosphatase YigB (HAD superfamily)